MSGPGETASTEGTVASEGATPEVVSMEAPIPVPTALRSPRPKPTLVRETHKPKKDKKKMAMSVHELPRKHSSTQAQKKDKQLEKVVVLEAAEGAEDIDAEGVDPISELPEYIPSRKGKVKVTKDSNVEKFVIYMPLLLENITFEGPRLAWVPLLKMEDWDLADHERFPHLMTNNYMKWVYYKDSDVTVLEPLEWIHGVNKSGC